MHVRTLLALSFAVLTGCATTSTAENKGAVGQQLRLVAQDAHGNPVDIGAQTGKVLLVDLWATWCEPCKESLPYFDKLAHKYGDKGLGVYAVSMDEDPKGVANFLKTLNVSLPQLWNSQGDKVAEQLGVARLPTTMIVDRNGVVRYVHEGYDEAAAREEQAKIEELLAH